MDFGDLDVVKALLIEAPEAISNEGWNFRDRSSEGL
jgi:hypothetical protein